MLRQVAVSLSLSWSATWHDLEAPSRPAARQMDRPASYDCDTSVANPRRHATGRESQEIDSTVQQDHREVTRAPWQLSFSDSSTVHTRIPVSDTPVTDIKMKTTPNKPHIMVHRKKGGERELPQHVGYYVLYSTAVVKIDFSWWFAFLRQNCHYWLAINSVWLAKCNICDEILYLQAQCYNFIVRSVLTIPDMQPGYSTTIQYDCGTARW